MLQYPFEIFQLNIFLYSESFLQSKKYKELEDLFACGFHHHVVSTLYYKCRIAVCREP